MSYVHSNHAFKWGVEIRFNRDATIFGTNPNGTYSFGGGTAYSPVLITSASGTHDIQPGDPLPDSLTGLLTATPYSYSIIAAADVTPTGDKFDEAAVRREAYNFYFQDTWKATSRLTLNYGLRYEVNSRIHEAENRTSLPKFVDANGKDVPYWDHNAKQIFLYNPQPPYDQDWNGWGPRLSVDYAVTSHTVLHAGGAITTILPNLWQDNFVTGGHSARHQPLRQRAARRSVALSEFSRASDIFRSRIPRRASFCFPTGTPATWPRIQQVDLQRYQDDLTGADAGQPGPVADHDRLRQEFSQRLYRELHGRASTTTFSDFKVQRCVRGHGRSSPGQRLFAEQLWRRRSCSSRRSLSSIPREKPSEVLGRRV